MAANPLGRGENSPATHFPLNPGKISGDQQESVSPTQQRPPCYLPSPDQESRETEGESQLEGEAGHVASGPGSVPGTGLRDLAIVPILTSVSSYVR